MRGTSMVGFLIPCLPPIARGCFFRARLALARKVFLFPRLRDADHVCETSGLCHEVRSVASGDRREQTFTARALTGSGTTKQMIPAVIVIALISLLVATEPEPASPTVHPSPEPP